MNLTKRQTEITTLLAQGLTAEEVAAKLTRALPTVRRHIQLAYERVGARNTAHLVAIAISKGFINVVCVVLIISMICQHGDAMRRMTAKRPVRRHEQTAIVI